jgi:hypothetical protein
MQFLDVYRDIKYTLSVRIHKYLKQQPTNEDAERLTLKSRVHIILYMHKL